MKNFSALVPVMPGSLLLSGIKKLIWVLSEKKFIGIVEEKPQTLVSTAYRR
jgi:hypothetical protein